MCSICPFQSCVTGDLVVGAELRPGPYLFARHFGASPGAGGEEPAADHCPSAADQSVRRQNALMAALLRGVARHPVVVFMVIGLGVGFLVAAIRPLTEADVLPP